MSFRLLLCVLVFSQTILTAQFPFAGPGAVWQYGFYAPGIIESRGVYRYMYEGDTLIQGVNTMAIREHLIQLNPDPPYTPFDTIFIKTIYRYQSSDSLMEWYNGNFHLQLKFNVVEGDTFTIRLGASTLIQVDSIREVSINNLTLKKYFVSGFGSGPLPLQIGRGIYYEKLGPEPGFYVSYCWNAGFDCYKPSLCTYRDDLFPLSHFSAFVCTQNFTETAAPTYTTEVRVYPNPAGNILFLENLPGSLQAFQVYNQLGQRIHIQSNLDTPEVGINISALPPGAYFFRLLTNHQWLHGQFVKG
ncbi:MAG TPA: T9SS type A sorting domain-containing protein [Saprospiraceae bacterium]|nr:T9SS type A sorting domain-containing protein [Saprospiraceae bacterium]